MRRCLALTLSLLPALAAAQDSPCMERDVAIAALDRGWQEALVAQALTNTTQVMEVFVNAETGSWTVLLTTPGGATCMVASGVGFRFVPQGEPT